MSAQFYAYLWFRDDGTPYYAGKGQGQRAFERRNHRQFPPKDISRIILFLVSSEAEAFDLEMTLIAWYGRKDLGTGCLRNMTNGGEGQNGHRLSDASKEKIAASRRGTKSPKSFSWRRRISETNTGRFYSAETRRKIGAASKGRNNGCRKYPPCPRAKRHHFRRAGRTQCACVCNKANKII